MGFSVAVQGYASLWALAFPPYAFFLMGKREGLAWTVLLANLMTLLFVNPYSMLPAYQYPPQFISRHLLTYIMISILIYNYESVRVRYLAAIRAEGAKLLREKERIEEIVTARTFEIKEKSRKLEDRERRYRLLADNVTDLMLNIYVLGHIIGPSYRDLGTYLIPYRRGICYRRNLVLKKHTLIF